MNKVFLIGKIEGDLKFDFILSGKCNSIVKFKIKLSNDSIVTAIAYDSKADYCYRNFEMNDIIILQGELNHKCDVILDEIWKFDYHKGEVS